MRPIRGLQEHIADAAHFGEAITLALCWAHLRRKFFDLANGGSAPIASKALDYIAHVYAIEKTIRIVAANTPASSSSG